MDERIDREYVRRLLAWNVSRRRAILGLSQEALGTKCGLHRTYVSRIERLEMSATIESVYMLSIGLETSVSLLFNEEGFIDSGAPVA
jgi:transcriptional regulator with XRE-family HTH domain